MCDKTFPGGTLCTYLPTLDREPMTYQNTYIMKAELGETISFTGVTYRRKDSKTAAHSNMGDSSPKLRT